jgi:multiple sugar transport system permease protein
VGAAPRVAAGLTARRAVLYAALLLGAALFLAPIVPALWEVLSIPYGTAVLNSIAISVIFTVVSTASSALAGFAFARRRIWWKEALFVVVLTTMMVPWIVLLIPQFVFFYRLGLTNTWWPWVLWSIQGMPLQIFLFRQFFASFPRELEDAAETDGSSRFRIFWEIFLPNSKPVIAVAATWAFIFVWGDFLTQDLLYISDPNSTLVVRLVRDIGVSQGFGGQPDLAGAVGGLALYSLPPIVLFLLVQRHILHGIAMTGLKR